ncbi:DUF5348 domain-containing protein [Virgibacillus sp. DJP39]|uniref:DUF5348 domain-containing protein n=1 Tax=Virgibacillus sp. DJP39 TaxID=3409790 RepID=UPI003BB62AA6
MSNELYDYPYSKGNTNLNDAEKELKEILYMIKKFSNTVGDSGELLEYDRDNKDEVFRKSTIRSAMVELENVFYSAKQRMKEIVNEGYLAKNTSGRYCFKSGEYLTSGDPIEILTYDDWEEKDFWIDGNIEHHTDYYHTGLGKEISLDGKYARQRK